jgi:hypothetical protein
MFAEVQIASLLPCRCECSVVHGCANIGRTGKSPRVCDPASREFTVVWPSGFPSPKDRRPSCATLTTKSFGTSSKCESRAGSSLGLVSGYSSAPTSGVRRDRS